MPKLLEHISEFELLKKYPKELFYEGNLELLKRKKVSIIGTRRPSKYAKDTTYNLAQALNSVGVCIVSGAAMGIDAIAHSASLENTIAVMPCGVDIVYPKVNKNLIENIKQKSLLLSQFDYGQKATPWSFVVRNELVVALGDILIVSEAELNSGSATSIEFALKMKKEIYVLPHRLNESGATNKLLKNNQAKAIYNIDEFVSQFGTIKNIKTDNFLEYCKTNPSYEEAVEKFPTQIFEAELNGTITVKNATIYLN